MYKSVVPLEYSKVRALLKEDPGGPGKVKCKVRALEVALGALHVGSCRSGKCNQNSARCRGTENLSRPVGSLGR